MALDISKIRQRQLETTSGGSGNFFKPIEGTNVIRIFKFSHKVTKDDVKNGYFSNDDLGGVMEELDRPLIRHFGISDRPVVSNKQIMDRYNELRQSTNNEDQEKASKIAPAKHYFFNVLNMNDLKKGMLLYACPKSVYNAILKYLLNEEYGGETKLFGASGRDFIIEYDKKKEGTEKYSVLLRESDRCKQLPGKVDDMAIDLYGPKFNEHVGIVEQEVVEDVPEDEIGETTPVKGNTKSTKSVDEEIEDIFGGAKKETKPAPKKTVKKPSDDDEVVDLSKL